MNSDQNLHFSGPDQTADQPPPSAERDFLITHQPIRLPRMGLWTPAVSLPLAQGRASAAGKCLPPASQRVCGDHAKRFTI